MRLSWNDVRACAIHKTRRDKTIPLDYNYNSSIEGRFGVKMSDHKPRYQIRPKEIPCPDGTLARFYEAYEIMMVEGKKTYHLNMDETFKTEQEAKSWIEQQSAKLC